MKYTLIFLILIAIIVGAVIYFEKEEPGDSDDLGKTDVYRNELFGVEFRYPEYYFLEARELGDAHRRHYRIELTEDTEENRMIREGKSPGRDGPVAITLDVFQNNLDKTPLTEWVRGVSDSNFKLSDGTYASTTIKGKGAITYHWSGLYEAESYVFEHRENIIMVTVTYITPEDQIRKDSNVVIQSLTFF